MQQLQLIAVATDWDSALSVYTALDQPSYIIYYNVYYIITGMPLPAGSAERPVIFVFRARNIPGNDLCVNKCNFILWYWQERKVKWKI